MDFPLRGTILAEAHSAILSGHLSEWKVYNAKLLVERHESGCYVILSWRFELCFALGIQERSETTPSAYTYKETFVAIHVLQLPLTSCGNKDVVFMDYFTKLVKAYAVPNQQTQTIARLLVENIVCRHGVPQELLSDSFLSELMRSLLGIKKVNTSEYHPQTDGLVKNLFYIDVQAYRCRYR